MKAWLWSLKCSLVYRGRSGWGAEECQWGFVYHKWVIAMKQLGPAGWSSPLCYGQQKTWQLDRAGGLNAFLTAISWVFCGQAGTDGGHGRGRHLVIKVLQRTSHNRFYNWLEWHQRSWACADWRLWIWPPAPFQNASRTHSNCCIKWSQWGASSMLLCNCNASDQKRVQRQFEYGIIACSPPSTWNTNAQCRKFLRSGSFVPYKSGIAKLRKL